MMEIKRKDLPLTSFLTTFECILNKPEMNKQIKKVIDKYGDGPERENVARACGENVRFLGFQDDVAGYMARAKALIFAAKEDFGITPVEAQSCGTPVIAFGEGGALETVVEGETGTFFSKQSPRAIAQAVEKFEAMQFDKEKIRQHALHFGKRRFQEEFSSFVDARLHSRGWSRDQIVAPIPQRVP